jgi:putative membrane protein
MIRLLIPSIVCACTTSLVVFATTASAQTTQSALSSDATKLHAVDQAFVADATKAVSTQRDAARIATARSTDREVKAFAERVATDDAKLSDALRAASPRGVDVPKNDPDTAVLDSIKNLRGGEFDKVYVEQVALGGEQKALSAFQSEIASGRDEQLKDAARNALPTIQAHYAQAQELAKRKHLADGSAQ